MPQLTRGIVSEIRAAIMRGDSDAALEALEALVACDRVIERVSRGEPVFVLRGQDATAPEAVRAWADAAGRAGCPTEKIMRAHARSSQMLDWQAANRDRVKVPD